MGATHNKGIGMATQFNRRALVIGAAALALAAVGYWGYASHQKREYDKSVLALVADTSMRLRDALNIETAPPTADRPSFIKRLADHAQTVDSNLQKLKARGSRTHIALADAADDYMVTAREIVKRQVETRRRRLVLADNVRLLNEHMRRDDRTGGWVQEAVKAKERVNKEYRDYQLAAEALDKLLGSFTASQSKILPYVDPKLVIADALVGEARRQAREDSRLAAGQFEKLQQLAASR
jgi:hypothetical protein